jgi:hypothetical protein
MKCRRINLLSLGLNLHSAIQNQVRKLQDEMVSKSQNLYSQTSAAPGKFLASGVQGMFVYDFDVELINVVDAHQIYVEGGTGIYMPHWWSPDKTEAALGYPGRSKPRPGRWIGGRGRNSPWIDLAGRLHPGSDKLIGGVEMIAGQPGQYRLAKKMHSILSIGRLEQLAKRAFSQAFRSATKEVIIK